MPMPHIFYMYTSQFTNAYAPYIEHRNRTTRQTVHVKPKLFLQNVIVFYTEIGCVPLDPSLVTNLDMNVINGAVVEFSCLENYLLIGETQAHCNGKDWSAPLPRCAGKTYINRDDKANEDFKLSC